MMAPFEGSGAWPAWMTRVASLLIALARAVDSVQWWFGELCGLTPRREDAKVAKENTVFLCPVFSLNIFLFLATLAPLRLGVNHFFSGRRVGAGS
jgi:predicted small integral membrane protein